MFYDNAAIQILIDRIGWAAAIQPSSFTLSTQNATGNSGRFFNDFHRMVIVENALQGMPNADADETDQNAFLYDKKRAAVRTVLAAIFDNNERAYYKSGCKNRRVDVSGTDYSSLINDKQGVFDNAIGYQMAYDIVEMMLTTTRVNAEQRSVQGDYGSLKTELEGYKNAEGVSISEGVAGKLAKAIKQAIEILFPDVKFSNRSIRGARPW